MFLLSFVININNQYKDKYFNNTYLSFNKGYYLSFGERCNKSPKTIEALKVTPLDRIFVESDESTTPIEQIYSLIANLRGVKSEELIEAIENNYNRIFSHDER